VNLKSTREDLQYDYLVGQDKSSIVKILGQEGNIYNSEIWTYFLKNDWLGRKLFLIVTFEYEKVVRIKIDKK